LSGPIKIVKKKGVGTLQINTGYGQTSSRNRSLPRNENKKCAAPGSKNQLHKGEIFMKASEKERETKYLGNEGRWEKEGGSNQNKNPENGEFY